MLATVLLYDKDLSKQFPKILEKRMRQFSTAADSNAFLLSVKMRCNLMYVVVKKLLE